MDLGLSGKVAFVTGASAGLGFAVARALYNEGTHVAICGRDPERIKQAALAIGGNVLPICCDVTKEDQIQQAVNEVVSVFGKLHVLVTNAGGPPSGFINNFSSKDWQDALDLNLMSTINLCRYAIAPLKAAAEEDGHARVLMITSISAKQPIPNLYLSNVARAGVQGFAKSLSEELGPWGITVNTLLPGFTKTERLGALRQATEQQTGQSGEDIEANWASANALKRLGEPEEFAAAAVFLASKPAAYITGIALPVDGGRAKGLM